jgi:general secretion pathway protein I
MKPVRDSSQRAFTLVEVLIALVVLAVGIVALVGGASDFARNASDLRQRAMARWVAENRLTELTLQARWPDTGKEQGSERMGGVEWEWETDVQKTPNGDIRRATITVRRERRTAVLARLEGFVGSPKLRGGQ